MSPSEQDGNPATLEKGAVEADFAELVDDQRQAPSAGALEQVAHQRRLAGTEEAGDDRAGDLVEAGHCFGFRRGSSSPYRPCRRLAIEDPVHEPAGDEPGSRRQAMSHPAEEPAAGRAVNPRSPATLRKGARGGAWNPGTDPLVLFDGALQFLQLVGAVPGSARPAPGALVHADAVGKRPGRAGGRGRSRRPIGRASCWSRHGQAYFRSEALFRTLRFMTYPWPLLRIGLILPRPRRGLALRSGPARNRYAVFGKKSACMIPSPELAARFLP